MVTLADITPTILDRVGAERVAKSHGRSVLPVLDGSTEDGWDEVLLSHVCHEVTMYYPMRTIRSPLVDAEPAYEGSPTRTRGRRTPV